MNQSIHDHGENDAIEFKLDAAYAKVAEIARQNLIDHVGILNRRDRKRSEAIPCIEVGNGMGLLL